MWKLCEYLQWVSVLPLVWFGGVRMRKGLACYLGRVACNIRGLDVDEPLEDLSMPCRLNIGCGRDVRLGWVNLDKYPCDESVVCCDLDREKLPFEDNCFDFICMSHILEHFYGDRFEILRDVCRVLKPGGVLEVRLPTFLPSLYHVSCFHPHSYLNPIVDYGIRGHVNSQRLYDFRLLSFRYVFLRFGLSFPFVHFESVWMLKKYDGG